jgi:hypothetical protein
MPVKIEQDGENTTYDLYFSNLQEASERTVFSFLQRI